EPTLRGADHLQAVSNRIATGSQVTFWLGGLRWSGREPSSVTLLKLLRGSKGMGRTIPPRSVARRPGRAKSALKSTTPGCRPTALVTGSRNRARPPVRAILPTISATVNANAAPQAQGSSAGTDGGVQLSPAFAGTGYFPDQ